MGSELDAGLRDIFSLFPRLVKNRDEVKQMEFYQDLPVKWYIIDSDA